MANIKVAVRVRPMSQKEDHLGGRHVVGVQEKTITITDIKVPAAPGGEGAADHRERVRHFAFDYTYYHEGKKSPAETPKQSPTRQKKTKKKKKESPVAAPCTATSSSSSVATQKDAEEERRQPQAGAGSEAEAEDKPHVSDQEMLYRELGEEMEAAAVSGYNACILAYGQSGSGKTYTVLGHKDAPGLAPRICEGLLTRLQRRYDPDDLCANDFSLTLSLIEIYNERVRDLLTGPEPGRPLRVREHPHTGPYVDGVTRHAITDTSVAWSLLERGRASRSVAPTASHAHSSRSHALLTLDITQPAAHTRSTLTLVDLAGSERAGEDGDKTRLTEGASINRSLVTLGNVISALAERGGALGSTRASPMGSSLSLNTTVASYPSYAHSNDGAHLNSHLAAESVPCDLSRRSSRLPFIPYRDSVLTWLLKDSLGGNAKTLMIATISPSSTSYSESVATLRYATRARCIVNVPVVNLDSGAATIRSLQKEVAALKRLLCKASPSVMQSLGTRGTALLDFISKASTLDLTREWIDRLHRDHEEEDVKRLRRRSAPPGGGGYAATKVSLNRSTSSLQSTEDVQSSLGPRDVIVESESPYLLNTLEDAYASSIIIYHIQNGASVVGSGENADLHLSGAEVAPSHCTLAHARGAVTLRCLPGCEVTVNNETVQEGGSKRLFDGDLITIGTRHFTFHSPTRTRPRSKSCPRRQVRVDSGTEPPPECDDQQNSAQDNRRQLLHKATQYDQPSAHRKTGCVSHSSVCVQVGGKGMGQSQAHFEEEEGHIDKASYESPRGQEEEGDWSLNESGGETIQVPANRDPKDSAQKRSLHSTWSDIRKVSGESMSEYEIMNGTTIKAPPIAERRSPLGASQSEGNISQRGPDLTDLEDDSGTKSHYCLLESYFFGSNNSIDSSISQPSCASLDSRLTHVSGSSNTYHSKLLPRNFFLDLNQEGRGCASATSTPLASPQSPSETRRHWDSSIWPEVERGLRRNQSVPDIRATKPVDDKRQHRKGSLQNPRSLGITSDDREKRQKIIEAVTQRLYPGSGPGFRRPLKRLPDKPLTAGERECSCRKKVGKIDPVITAIKGNDTGTPSQTKRFSVGAPVSPRSQWDTNISFQTSSLKSPPGSLLPIPVYGDSVISEKSSSGSYEISSPIIAQKIKKPVTRKDFKPSTPSLVRMSKVTESKVLGNISQNTNIRMSDQAIGAEVSSSDYDAGSNMERQQESKNDASILKDDKEKFVKSSSPPENRLQRQAARSDPDLLSDVVGAAGGGERIEGGEEPNATVEEKAEQERERRKIPLTPGLFKLQRALASLNDPEKFSDDSLELPTLDADSLSPSASRFSPPILDEDELSLGDISKDSLEDVTGAGISFNFKDPSVKEKFASGLRPPLLKEKKDSFIEAFYNSVSLPDPTDSLEIEEEYPSLTDDSSDIIVPESNKSSSYNSYNSPNSSSSRSSLPHKTIATSMPSTNTLSVPKGGRRSARERAEKRILDSTSSEESDGDSRRRPRFRRRKGKRASLPVISMDTIELETRSDSTEYLSLRHSSPEKEEALGRDKDDPLLSICRTSKSKETLPEEWREDSVSLYDNVSNDSFVNQKSAKLRSFQVRYGKEIPEPPLPSERESPMLDFLPQECRVMQHPGQRQVENVSCSTSSTEIGTTKNVDTQVILKESARRLFQAVNKDGVMSEASQDAVANLLKASSQHLASYSLGMAMDVNVPDIIRSDSVTTQDEDYDTAQGEDAWQESSNDSQSSSKKYSSIQCPFPNNGAVSKSISPQSKKTHEEVSEKISGMGEKASFSGVISSGSGHDDAACETEDCMTSTTSSDVCSTEGSWEEMDMESYQKIQDSSLSKEHVEVIAAEFTPRTARRLLYTIVECSESSRSEGIPSESDVIPSDWRDTLSETGEEFASEHVTDDISENLMSSSDETMLDTVRQTQEDPQDSLSCVSDDILGDSKYNILDDSIAGNSQHLAKNLSGSLEFLTNLPLSPDMLESGEQVLSCATKAKLQNEEHRKGEHSLVCEEKMSPLQVMSDDDQNVFISSTQSNKDVIPDYVPSLDLSSVKDNQQSPIKRKDMKSSSQGEELFYSNEKSILQMSSGESVSSPHSHVKPVTSITTVTVSNTQMVPELVQYHDSEVSSQLTKPPLGKKINDMGYQAQAIPDQLLSQRQSSSYKHSHSQADSMQFSDQNVTEVISVAAETDTCPKNVSISSLERRDTQKMQISLGDETFSQGVTPVTSQNSHIHGASLQRITPLTPQNSLVDGTTHQSVPLTPQNSLADENYLQNISTLTPQNSMADGAVPGLTPLTPQNLLADGLSRQEINPSPHQNLMAIETVTRITPLTPQNSLADGSSLQEINPLTLQNSLVDRTSLQRTFPVTPQDSLADGIFFQRITPLIPQNLLVDGTAPRITPLTPQNSVADETVPRSTPLTPQNSVVDGLSFQEMTQSIPQNSLVDVSNVQRITQQNSPTDGTFQRNMSSLILQTSIADGTSRLTNVPLTPQNSVVEGDSIQNMAPELLQYLVANKMGSQSIFEIQQYSVTEECSSSNIMPLTPQNSLADGTILQEGLCSTSSNSSVEIYVTSEADFGKETVRHKIEQTSSSDGTASQKIPPLTPQNSLAEGAIQNITPELLQNLLACGFAVQKALPQTSQQLEGEGISSVKIAPLTPQNFLVEGSTVQNITPEILEYLLSGRTDSNEILQETLQNLLESPFQEVVHENLQVSAAEKVVIKTLTPHTVQDPNTEKNFIQDIAPQISELTKISLAGESDTMPKNVLDVATVHQKPPPTPQNSLSEDNIDNLVSTEPQCLMEEAGAIEGISSQTSNVSLMVDSSCAENQSSQHSSTVAVGGVPQASTPLNSSSGAVYHPTCESASDTSEDVDMPPAIFQDGRSVTKNVFSSTASSQESAANLMAQDSLARHSSSEVTVNFSSQNFPSVGNTNSLRTPVAPSQYSLPGTTTSKELPVISSQNPTVEVSSLESDMNLYHKCMQQGVNNPQESLTKSQISTIFLESAADISFGENRLPASSENSSSISLPDASSHEESVLSPPTSLGTSNTSQKALSVSPHILSKDNCATLTTVDNSNLSEVPSIHLPQTLSSKTKIQMASLSSDKTVDVSSTSEANTVSSPQVFSSDISHSKALPSMPNQTKRGENVSQKYQNDDNTSKLSQNSLCKLSSDETQASEKFLFGSDTSQTGDIGYKEVNTILSPQISEFSSEYTSQLSSTPTSQIKQNKFEISQEAHSSQISPELIGLKSEINDSHIGMGSLHKSSPMSEIPIFHSGSTTQASLLPKTFQSGGFSDQHLPPEIPTAKMLSSQDSRSFQPASATDASSSQKDSGLYSNITSTSKNHEVENVKAAKQILSTPILSHSKNIYLQDNEHEAPNQLTSTDNKVILVSESTTPNDPHTSGITSKSNHLIPEDTNIKPLSTDGNKQQQPQQQQNITTREQQNYASRDLSHTLQNVSGTDRLPYTDISDMSTVQKATEVHLKTKTDNKNLIKKCEDKQRLDMREAYVHGTEAEFIMSENTTSKNQTQVNRHKVFTSDTEDTKVRIQKYNLPKIAVEQNKTSLPSQATAVSAEDLTVSVNKDHFTKVLSPNSYTSQDASELQMRSTVITGEIPRSQVEGSYKETFESMSGKESSRSLSSILPSGSPFHQQSNRESSTESGYKRIVRQISSFDEQDPKEVVTRKSTTHLKVSDNQTQDHEEGKLTRSSVVPQEQDEQKQALSTTFNSMASAVDVTAQTCNEKMKKHDYSRISTNESPRSGNDNQHPQQQSCSSAIRKVDNVPKMELTQEGNQIPAKLCNKELNKKLFQGSDLQSLNHTEGKILMKHPQISDSSLPDPARTDTSSWDVNVGLALESSANLEMSGVENERKNIPQQGMKSGDENLDLVYEAKDSKMNYSRGLCSTSLLSDVQDKNKTPLNHRSEEAPVEVIVSDYSEPCALGHENDSKQESDNRSGRGLSSKGREQKQTEKLTSSTWQGTFIMEHEQSEDDWGASNESITFIFMTPGEEDENPPDGAAIQTSYGTTRCSNYRSSSDLSHIGLNIGMSNETQYIHPYDLYKTNCRRLIRTTSLDSISCALQKLGQSKVKAEMQRTCSLEDMTQEMAAILERGRMFSVESGIEILSDTEATLLGDREIKYKNNKTKKSAGFQDSKDNSDHLTASMDETNQRLNSQSSCEDDVFAKSPSPILTYGQVSMGDWKNMILGRSVSPASMRRMAGETSKSSPQLHQRPSENLKKKSVSWTDLQGCGALEIEVTELNEVKEMSIKPVFHVKSIMKKPSLAPIAPTPPPGTPPTSDYPPPNVLRQIHPKSLPVDVSDDEMPLPRSNLKEIFSLQLPPYIRDRAFRTSSPISENEHSPCIPGSPSSKITFTNDPQLIKLAGASNFTDVKSVEHASKSPTSPGLADSQSTPFDITQADCSTSDAIKFQSTSLSSQEPIYNYRSYSTSKPAKYEHKNMGRLSSSSSAYSNTESCTLTTASQGNISSGASSQGSSPVFENEPHEISNFGNLQRHSSPAEISNLYNKSSQIPPLTQCDASFQVSSPIDTVSAPTTPGENITSSLIPSSNDYMPRYKSEGDLTRTSGEGLSNTWVTLSKVMQEAGTILKTLSETSLVLHHQIAGPDQRGSLPPVMEESSTFFDNKRVSSVAVQTEKTHRTRTNIRSTIAQTSFESSSDTENADGSARLSSFQSRLLTHKASYRKHGSDIISSESRGMSVLKDLNRLRRERERMNNVMSQYDSSTFNTSFSKNRPAHKSSSSDLDSPISSLMTSFQNITTQTPYHERELSSERHSYHQLSATSQHYLAMYHRRLQESCHQLEERLRLSARKRKLRSRLLSNSHSHFHTDPAKMALHASLDFAKSPFCGRPDSASSTPYMSTSSLPSIGPPQSPVHARRDALPCCCISPTHQSHHNHLCSPSGTCSAHTHWASCHAAPTSDQSYTPQCLNARIRTSSQQCRDQLLHLRKQLVSTSGLASSSSSLGDTSPPGRGNSHSLRGMRNIFDTPYQRDQAASLSSLPLTSNHRGWRHNVTGSTASVASEGEADRPRWTRHRLDSDSDSGAGWSSSGTSLRHTCY